MPKRKRLSEGVSTERALKAIAKTGNVVPYQSTVVTVNQARAPSLKVVSTEYDVWSDIPVKDDTLDTVVTKYTPKETGTNPVVISVPKADENLPDLSRSFLVFKVYATRTGNNGNLGADNAYFKNNVFHTIIKQIEITLNNTVVTLNSDNYHQESYVTTLLNHDKEEQETFLTCQGWSKDVYNHMNSRNAGENTALPKRGVLTDKKRFMLIGFPICDLTKTDKLLPPGLKIDFKIYLNDPKLIFMASGADAANTPTLVFDTPELHLARKIPSPELWEKLERRWTSSPWTIPLPHTKIKTYNLGTSTNIFQFDDLFNGEIPKTLAMWMVPVTALNGDYQANQYNYERHNLTSVEIKLNGKDFVDYAKTLTDEHLTSAYMNMKLQDGLPFASKKGPHISQEEFKQGYFILLFDLTRGRVGHLAVGQLPRTGNLAVYLKFHGNLTNAVQLFVMGTFDRILEIDHLGNVTYPM